MKKHNPFLLLGFLVLLGILAVAQTEQINSSKSVPQEKQDSEQPKYKPKDGYVPDEETAIAIAVAVWNSIYGKEKIKSEKPFRASLKDDVWTITGSLPKGRKGGTAIAEISKDDGRILRVIHGK